MEYYVYHNDQQQGPYTIEALRGLHNRSLISDQTLIWHEGLTDWKPFWMVGYATTPIKRQSIPHAPQIDFQSIEKNTKETAKWVKRISIGLGLGLGLGSLGILLKILSSTM